MQYINVGSLTFSRIIQGFWRLGSWKWSKEELALFMKACIERGVTTFDTAEIYDSGECERQLGEVFSAYPEIRNSIQLVSKTGIYLTEVRGSTFGYYNTTKESIIRSCNESLSRLQRDHIDLYLIHREDPLLDPWDSVSALEELKQQGKIREYGVSNFDPYKLEGMNTASKGSIVTNQIELNPLCFEHFNSGMMDYLVLHHIHPMVWSPLAGGRIFKEENATVLERFSYIASLHDADVSTIIYAWLLYHPSKPLPISGSNRIDRLELAIKALDVKLEHWQWYYLYTASGEQVLR